MSTHDGEPSPNMLAVVEQKSELPQTPNADTTEKVLVGTTAAAGTTAVVASVAAVPYAAGFTAAGVSAGSAAAAAQASIGSVAAGSWFATMQSVAATTLIGTAGPAIIAGTAVVATAVGGALLYSHVKNKNANNATDDTEVLRDGEPSRNTLIKRFYEMMPVLSNYKSFFFELLHAGNKAGMSYQKVMIRYLSLCPGGLEFYDNNKTEIDKADMNEGQAVALYNMFAPSLDTRNIITVR